MNAKVITIAQQKGGAGKTTIAAHLAVAFSQMGLRVAAIDIDPQGSLSHWHRIREEKFGEGYTGITFGAFSGWRISGELSRLKRNFDVIVLDSPPHTETETRAAIRNADLLIIPVQPSPTDLWATQATIDIAKSEKVSYITVLNRVSANSKIAETISKELSNLSNVHLGNRVYFASSIMEGKCVTETSPKSPAAEEVKALSEEVLKIAGINKTSAFESENEDEKQPEMA